MLSCLSWVPRGAPVTKLPSGIDNTKDKDDDDQAEPMETSINNENELSDEEGAEESNDVDSNQVEVGSEVDIGEVLANELDTLAFYKDGEKDPNLKSDPKSQNLFDEDELDDLNMRATDSLIVSVKSGEDVSALEVHVFDDDPDASDEEDHAYIPHTYIHHDVVLPALPLCTAYTQLTIGEGTDAANLVAVGMFTPGIDIWDVDRVNNLEPVATLGGYDVSASMATALSAARQARRGGKARRKRKSKPQLLEGSHSSAVMSLSWNQVQKEYLASGSADTTIKIWDIESTHCASTLSHHSDKVQAVAFHPSEAHLIASGSFDKTVQVGDVRAAEKSFSSWTVTADVETIQWGSHSTQGFIVSTTEDGNAFVIDPRKTGTDGIVARWKAHTGAATTCTISPDISGLMVTAGIDKTVKVWDLSAVSKTVTPDLVYERPSKAGALFTVALCDLPKSQTESNASPFVIAYGGSKGVLKVIDLAVESQAVRDRFLKQCNSLAVKAIEGRAQRQSRARSRPNNESTNSNNKMTDDADGSNDEEENDDDDLNSDSSQSDHDDDAD